jgi:bifunctional DNA-binding transcriptional regulator/antitoxin component of YhaV-PrlF toxin-antitoxin module
VVPPTILIQGDRNLLAEIDDIRTEKVDIDNEKETIRNMFNFVIPTGVRVAYNIKDAEVVIDIERIEEKKMNISTADLLLVNKRENFDYVFKRNSLELEISGAKSLLNFINSENLNIEVDVGELQIGEGRVLASINLPDGIEPKNDLWIEVEVLGKF